MHLQLNMYILNAIAEIKKNTGGTRQGCAGQIWEERGEAG